MSAGAAVIEARELGVTVHGADLCTQRFLSKAAGSRVIGPNGAGKPTLLRALNGLIPASGELLFQDDRSAWAPPLASGRHRAASCRRRICSTRPFGATFRAASSCAASRATSFTSASTRPSRCWASPWLRRRRRGFRVARPAGQHCPGAGDAPDRAVPRPAMASSIHPATSPAGRPAGYPEALSMASSGGPTTSPRWPRSPTASLSRRGPPRSGGDLAACASIRRRPPSPSTSRRAAHTGPGRHTAARRMPARPPTRAGDHETTSGAHRVAAGASHRGLVRLAVVVFVASCRFRPGARGLRRRPAVGPARRRHKLGRSRGQHGSDHHGRRSRHPRCQRLGPHGPAVLVYVGADPSDPQRFVIVIPITVFKRLSADQQERLPGALVRASGTIISYSGAATIVVQSPRQLQIR